MRIDKNLLIVLIISIALLSSYFVVIKSTQTVNNEIYVDSAFHTQRDGTAEHPYQSIQYAINQAETGDTIYIFGGTYNETIRVNKKIDISGSIDDTPSIIRYNAEHTYTVEINEDYVTLEGITVKDDGEYISSYTNGALIHVTADNVIIQNNNINNSKNGHGIFLDESTGAVIGANNINTTKNGIYLYNSVINDIINNNISDCHNNAISLSSSEQNRIYNNSIYDNLYGIYAKQSLFTNISNNTISGSNQHGIAFYTCNNDIVYNNKITNNNIYGLYLNSEKSNISKNEVMHNQIGIYIDESDCILKDNFVNHSSGSGISTGSGTKSNIIYKNHLNNNYVNARENGMNLWFFNEHGNFWDDYNEVDRDLDGIGDSYYKSKGVVDKYPLGIFLQPPNKPSNPIPEDDAEDVGLKIDFNVTVEDPDGGFLTVTFYDATTNTSFGSVRHVASGETGEYRHTLNFDRTFLWYAVVSDEKNLQNQSDIWFFTTKQRPPENKKPVALPGGPYTASIGEDLILDASSSYDPDGTIDFYRWNFGDGSSEILKQSPSHSYKDPGEYTATLTVIDNQGRSNTDTTTVTIYSEKNSPPVAVLPDSYSSAPDKKIIFDGSQCYDPDGNEIITYNWTFGDESHATGPIVEHSYKKNGAYLVVLTIFDDKGATDSTSTMVTVKEPTEETPGYESALFFFAIVLLISILLLHHRKKIQ